jgi:hypothetical protein
VPWLVMLVILPQVEVKSSYDDELVSQVRFFVEV